MTTVDDARAAVRAVVAPLSPRVCAFADSIGATLAEPLRAGTAFPPADVAAMDGYAVRGADGPWQLRADVQLAGGPVAAPLRRGEAIRIGTGAHVPAGSTAVIRDEYVTAAMVAQRSGIARRPGTPTRDDTRRRGENWLQGAELASVGRRISLAVVSTAAAADIPALVVRGRPRAHIILTGDEITTARTLEPGQTRDCLGPVLSHYLTGVDVDCCGESYCPDDADQLARLLARHKNADVLYVVGATRLGPADHLREALRQLRAEIIVAGLSCRPGGTQLVAILPNGTVVHCLPGNPYAAVAALLMITPAIVDALTARTPAPAWRIQLAGTSELTSPAHTRVLPATRRPDGGWHIDPTIGTPHLAGLIGRHALALVFPPGAIATCDTVEILPIPT